MSACWWAPRRWIHPLQTLKVRKKTDTIQQFTRVFLRGGSSRGRLRVASRVSDRLPLRGRFFAGACAVLTATVRLSSRPKPTATSRVVAGLPRIAYGIIDLGGPCCNAETGKAIDCKEQAPARSALHRKPTSSAHLRRVEPRNVLRDCARRSPPHPPQPLQGLQ